jgi:hypothetical protein
MALDLVASCNEVGPLARRPGRLPEQLAHAMLGADLDGGRRILRAPRGADLLPVEPDGLGLVPRRRFLGPSRCRYFTAARTIAATAALTASGSRSQRASTTALWGSAGSARVAPRVARRGRGSALLCAS